MSAVTRVVVADDSPFVRGLICAHLSADPHFEVVAATDNGVVAVQLIQQLRPDVMTLDIDMPGLNGLETLQRVMETCPTPAVMLSGVSHRAAETIRHALHAGAVDFILKYVPGSSLAPDVFRRELLEKVRKAASVRVVRSLASRIGTGTASWRALSSCRHESRSTGLPVAPGHRNIVVIGASTGGPIAIGELLQQLPAGFPAAIVVVQHLVAAFTSAFATLLAQQVSLPTGEAQDGQPLEHGFVYIAPGDRHLTITPASTIRVSDGPKVSGYRPSVDVAMQSVAHAAPSRCFGVLLTGMGSDGIAGMTAIHNAGGTTFGQTLGSCVVDSMPKGALAAGVIQVSGTPAEIGAHLRRKVMQFRGAPSPRGAASSSSEHRATMICPPNTSDFHCSHLVAE